MNSERRVLHEKAMQAAISVTLALGVACSPKPRPFDGDADGTVSVDTGAARDTGAASGGADAGGADTGGADTASPEPSDTCADIIDMTELMACCEALAAACDARFPDDWEAAYECAWGAETGCTPWGPPVPPVA